MRGRLEPGHAVGLHPRPGRLLGRRIRLAVTRGRAQPLRPVHHRDRRARHSFHPPPVAARRRVPAADHPRLARLDCGVPQGDRAADQPGVRARRGRLPRGLPVAAGVWLLRQAHSHGLGRREDRPGLGDVDAAPGLRPLRRPGRRLGRRRDHADRPKRGPLRGHPPQHADRAAHAGVPEEPDGRRAARAGSVGRSPEVGHRLFQAAVHPAADAGLRAGRFAGGAVGVDRREVLGVGRLRRPSGERVHPGRAARQRDGLLGDRHRRVLGPLVLGELQGLGANGPCRIAHGRRGFPRRDPGCSAVSGASRSTTSRTGQTMPRGGHFAAFEQPELFVEDVRAFFATVRA